MKSKLNFILEMLNFWDSFAFLLLCFYSMFQKDYYLGIICLLLSIFFFCMGSNSVYDILKEKEVN